MTFEFYLAPEAEADIDDILEWSVTQFGAAIRDGLTLNQPGDEWLR